jgi:1-acyl-sn-glycerol-3-phosphate acyltransferase
MAAIQELSGQEPANTYNNPPATIVERVRRALQPDDPTAAAVDPD